MNAGMVMALIIHVHSMILAHQGNPVESRITARLVSSQFNGACIKLYHSEPEIVNPFIFISTREGYDDENPGSTTIFCVCISLTEGRIGAIFEQKCNGVDADDGMRIIYPLLGVRIGIRFVENIMKRALEN